MANEGAIIYLDGEHLSLETVAATARRSTSDRFPTVALSPEAKKRMAASRELVERWSREEKPRYGINTGFGGNQDKRIRPDEVLQLQERMIRSHAAGVGEPLPEEVVRGMMVLRANALAKGYSGIRVEVVERLLEMLNREVCPVVPSKGSVGSSGDLAPLAHMTLAMLDIPGRAGGEALYEGRRMPASEALRLAGIRPVKLMAKEGLALTNGTQMMTAIGALALVDAENLVRAADIAGALSLEALKGRSAPFLDLVQEVRPFQGQRESAANVRTLTAESELKDCRDDDTKAEVQDAYSIRCLPQVHGASREAFGFVRRILSIEINSVTDNPLIFGELADPVEAGNFHGQPVALAMDFISLALAEIGNISERRTAYLLDHRRNRGLPPFLVREPGLNSGMMIAQYTAAALVSENKSLIHPASGDSIPTSANQEDHNSMGSIAARHAREILENVEHVVAIELLCAAQALDLRGGRPGGGTTAALSLIRRHVSFLDEDRELYPDIQRLRRLIHDGQFVREVERVCLERGLGPLG